MTGEVVVVGLGEEEEEDAVDFLKEVPVEEEVVVVVGTADGEYFCNAKGHNNFGVIEENTNFIFEFIII